MRRPLVTRVASIRPLVHVFIALAGLFPAAQAIATVGPPVEVRWQGEWPAPAKRGVEVVGRFEISAGPGVVVEDLRIEPGHWSVKSFDGPSRVVMPARSKQAFSFRAVPEDPTAPLVVTGRANGIPFRQAFGLDAATLSTIGRRTPVELSTVPKSSPSAPGATNATIRFHGRIVYPRRDSLVVGVDNIVVKAMDADPAPVYEEMIGFALTDANGYFDFTVNWTDLDGVTIDIPDVFLLIEAANLKVNISAEGTGDLEDWSTEANPIMNYTGSDLSFGTVSLSPDSAAAHIWNSMIKADRHAREQGGMDAPLVYVHWPFNGNQTYYSSDVIRITSGEEWLEGTHVHEYGHHLAQHFSTNAPMNYSNGVCDTPDPGHCAWCPENDIVGWQEGWADWFGSRLLRVWQGAYGYKPFASGDMRYVLESPFQCGDDLQLHQTPTTEGFVGMLLRDIEDGENETDPNFNACGRDLLSEGDGIIFQIFRDDDPGTAADFIADYRARRPSDLNLWHTIQLNLPSLNFVRPALAITSQPPSCRRARLGSSIQLTVGANSGKAHYEWLQDGHGISNLPGSGWSGVTSATLTIGPLTPQLAGRYTCEVRACDGTELMVSTATDVLVDAPALAGSVVSWGVNGAGTVGDGTASGSTRRPFLHPGLSNMVKVDGGQPHTVALTSNGDVYTWGFSNVGELGRGVTYGAGYTPSQVLSGATDIAAGDAHSVALVEDGTMRAWGSNFYGQLFLGNRNDKNVPTATMSPGCVRRVAAGTAHTLVLLQDGTVRGVGYNSYGNLGTGTASIMELNAQQAVGLTGVVAIDAASYWSMALKADGTVWTWGINTWGQLGLGHTGTVMVPTQVAGLTNISQILATPHNGYALKADGTLYAWGYGPSVGIGNTGSAVTTPQLVPLSNVTKIVGGPYWAMALVGTRLKAWGLNAGNSPTDSGLFNTPTNYTVPSPVDVQGVYNVTNVFSGWTTAHALGSGIVADAPTPPGDELPTQLALGARPNPSHGTSSIFYDLPKGGAVSLRVYDAAGRLVRDLLEETRVAGRHVATWDGRTASGSPVRAGLYFMRLQTEGQQVSRTLVRIE